jgi:hypothetical protein
MTDAQLISVALASGPTMIAVLVGILVNNSRLSDLPAHMDMRFGENDRRMDDMRTDLKETWRAELRRVEEVLDARLRHIEER